MSVFMFLSTHFLLVNNVRYSLPSNTLKKPYYIYFLPPYLFPSPCSRYNGTCQSCIGSLRKLNLNFRMAGLRQIILTKNKFSLKIQPVPKGQLISKTIYGVLDSPKKTNENHLTCYIIVLWYIKSNGFRSFFWRS